MMQLMFFAVDGCAARLLRLRQSRGSEESEGRRGDVASWA